MWDAGKFEKARWRKKAIEAYGINKFNLDEGLEIPLTYIKEFQLLERGHYDAEAIKIFIKLKAEMLERVLKEDGY